MSGTATSARVGGRPRRIEHEDIVRAGRRIGMRELSLNAVAAALGVSSTALYRHVDGRWGLESLVGESLLADLRLIDDPRHDVARHLLSFGIQLRDFVLSHPGLAAYLQTLFPRGDAGRALIAHEVEALGRRGYAPDAAVVLSSSVASVAIGYAAAEDLQRERADGLDRARLSAAAELAADAELGAAHERLPAVDWDDYVRLLLSAAIRGLVDVAPPGRAVADVIAELRSAGEGI
ncbi:TetR/AcrR family transcriptional regulator [Microbacterium sp.]|uniref:TetR/AcrR family transcriptional regulator n=1 Tax=Microbacterium sp. TaxID=51671 RepID=UPI0039E4E2D8